MRRNFILLLVVGILFCCHCGKVRKKQIKWQGKIEYQDDIRVMKNPNKPFFGELVLEWKEDLSIGNKEDENYIFSRIQDLEVDKQGNIYVLDTGNYRVQKFDKNGKYFQTIGKKGQSPGEFENLSNLFIDAQNSLYVLEGRKIQIFNNDGKFLKSLSLSYDFWNFAVSLEGNIWAIASIRSEAEENFRIIIDPEGKMLKNIIEFPGMTMVRSGGLEFSVSHNYSPRVCFSSINQNAFIYGYSSNYKLFLLNRNGKIFLIIEKEELPRSITLKEKNKVINIIIEYTARGGRKWPKDVVEKAATFPKYCPFFDKITVDNKERIWIQKTRSVLTEEKEIEFDIFSQDGYYLYKTTFPFHVEIIRNGYFYCIYYSAETGEESIKRYRIKSWKYIKEGI